MLCLDRYNLTVLPTTTRISEIPKVSRITQTRKCPASPKLQLGNRLREDALRNN